MSANASNLGTVDLTPVRLNVNDTGFWPVMEKLLAFEGVADAQVMQTVQEVIAAVRRDGDKAVMAYTAKFDALQVDSMADLEIPPQRLQQAWESISDMQRQALQTAAERIRLYHERQVQQSWSYQEDDGTVLGQQMTPLDRVGLYVPGGKAAYPSTLLMNAVPAKVAGVQELIVTVPTPHGDVNELVLAAAKVGGVDKVYAVGGAQAVAALAYGTQSIAQVDKIVGPGNIYVAAAKALVFGQVGIDMIAGPSEILVIGDGSTDPAWVAMDLFSQAEHDEIAQPILVSTDCAYTDAVLAEMKRLLPGMERAPIIAASFNNRGALIDVDNMDQAIAVANHVAPEHLELSVKDPHAYVARIRHAGAIFIGKHTCEALGDYCAGPNHVLPTSRTARFSSPLGVYDFQKRTSVIDVSHAGSQTLGKTASVLARGEGLTAHARSAEYRIDDD